MYAKGIDRYLERKYIGKFKIREVGVSISRIFSNRAEERIWRRE